MLCYNGIDLGMMDTAGFCCVLGADTFLGIYLFLRSTCRNICITHLSFLYLCQGSFVCFWIPVSS